MALGATTCSNKIYEAFLDEDKSKTFFHGHSYTGNPVACAAGVASLELLLQHETQEHIQRIAGRHQKFAAAFKALPAVKEVRQQGTILAIEFDAGVTTYFNNLRDTLYNFALEQGVLLRPLGNIIYILPPYCISDPQLDKVYETIAGMQQLVSKI